MEIMGNLNIGFSLLFDFSLAHIRFSPCFNWKLHFFFNRATMRSKMDHRILKFKFSNSIAELWSISIIINGTFIEDVIKYTMTISLGWFWTHFNHKSLFGVKHFVMNRSIAAFFSSSFVIKRWTTNGEMKPIWMNMYIHLNVVVLWSFEMMMILWMDRVKISHNINTFMIMLIYHKRQISRRENVKAKKNDFIGQLNNSFRFPSSKLSMYDDWIDYKMIIGSTTARKRWNWLLHCYKLKRNPEFSTDFYKRIEILRSKILHALRLFTIFAKY